MSSTQDRAELVVAIQRQSTLEGQLRAVAALDEFDASRRAEAAEAHSIDLANTAVERLSPVRVHEHHTAATDWLGTTDADSGPYAHQIVAEGALWFSRVSAAVKADQEEFGLQAEGFMRRQASQYGEDAEKAYQEGLAHLGWLYRREAASGLDQIQQTVDPNNQAKTTPLNPEVFDNFAPEVDPVNAGVVGTETSERAPLLQEIEQKGNGSAAPEKPGGHSTTDDFSGGYSEVPVSGPEAMTGQASLDTRSVALESAHGNLDDYRAYFAREGASTLEQVQEVVDANNQPHPENPLPEAVMFPWLIGPDAYGTKKDQSPDDVAKAASWAGGDDPFRSAPEGARSAAIRSTKPMVAGEGAYLYNPHDSGQKHTVSPGTKTTPGSKYVDMFGEHADHKVEGLPGEWQLGGEWHHHDGSGSVTGSLQTQANYVAGVLSGMDDGDEKTFPHPIGTGEYKVRYDSQQALGDNNKPAKGYTVGDYHVTAPDGQIKHFHHTPHGPTLEQAKPYAARQAAAWINDHYRNYVPPTKKGSLQAEAGDPVAGLAYTDCENCDQTTRSRDKGGVYSTCASCGADLPDDLKDRHEYGPGGGSTLKNGSRKTADMFGNSDQPHAVPQPNVANTPATTPGTGDSYQQGVDDGEDGDSPTYSDGRMHPGYAQGYPQGVENAKARVPQSVPRSLGGDNERLGAFKVSSLFTKDAALTNPDFLKGYHFASRWDGGPLALVGSPEFESGIYAGITDNLAAQGAWVGEHQKWAPKFPVLAQRLEVHESTTATLVERGVLVKHATFENLNELECYSCGHRDKDGSSFFADGKGRKCPKCGSEQVYHPDAGSNWGKGKKGAKKPYTDPTTGEFVGEHETKDDDGEVHRTTEWFGSEGEARDYQKKGPKKTGATSTDLDSTGPNSSPDPSGQTPINGPGTPPPLEGQGPPNAPAGPGPYQGAPPYGHPVVTNVPTPTSGPHTVDDTLGGPLDGNARVTSAFRQRVQGNLLRSLSGQPLLEQD